MTEIHKPLSIIYNQKSGFHTAYQDQLYECILTLFNSYGFDVQVFDLAKIANFDDLMQAVVQHHLQAEQRGIVVVAGGDGTLNTVAGKLLQYDIPIGILPMGTFNYVARLLKIPLDLVEAAQVIVTGNDRPVHVARINDHIYLNNASLGLYPLFIQRREQFNRYLGRLPWHAYTSALDVVLRHRKELNLLLDVDGQSYPLTTPLIFFGNNQLQLQEMNLRIAACAAEGRVTGAAIARSDKWTLMKMVWQMLRGNLEKVPEIQSFCADQVVVYAKKKRMMVAFDGEITEMTTPLRLSVYHHALKIRVPYAVASV